MQLMTISLFCGILFAVSSSNVSADDKKPASKDDNRVFEMRTYYANPGKMDALHARFRDHTCKLFEKHGITIIGFWSPMKKEDAEQKLVYMLAFPSMEAAKKSWKDFSNDPEWKKVHAESEKDGKLVAKIESVYLNPTDYSPIK
jgi:hypothetical protein